MGEIKIAWYWELGWARYLGFSQYLNKREERMVTWYSGRTQYLGDWYLKVKPPIPSLLGEIKISWYWDEHGIRGPGIWVFLQYLNKSEEKMVAWYSGRTQYLGGWYLKVKPPIPSLLGEIKNIMVLGWAWYSGARYLCFLQYLNKSEDTVFGWPVLYSKTPNTVPIRAPRQTYVNLAAMLQNNLCLQNNFGLKPMLHAREANHNFSKLLITVPVVNIRNSTKFN